MGRKNGDVEFIVKSKSISCVKFNKPAKEKCVTISIYGYSEADKDYIYGNCKLTGTEMNKGTNNTYMDMMYTEDRDTVYPIKIAIGSKLIEIFKKDVDSGKYVSANSDIRVPEFDKSFAHIIPDIYILTSRHDDMDRILRDLGIDSNKNIEKLVKGYDYKALKWFKDNGLVINLKLV